MDQAIERHAHSLCKVMQMYLDSFVSYFILKVLLWAKLQAAMELHACMLCWQYYIWNMIIGAAKSLGVSWTLEAIETSAWLG